MLSHKILLSIKISKIVPKKLIFQMFSGSLLQGFSCHKL